MRWLGAWDVRKFGAWDTAETGFWNDSACPEKAPLGPPGEASPAALSAASDKAPLRSGALSQAALSAAGGA